MQQQRALIFSLLCSFSCYYDQLFNIIFVSLIVGFPEYMNASFSVSDVLFIGNLL